MFSSIFILEVLFFSCCIVTVRSNSRGCVPLPPTVNDVWLKTESMADTFSSQIFSLYSYIPAAIIFNASGIVIGDFYSRKPSHDTNVFTRPNMLQLSFTSFFDWHYFQHYWKNSPISNPIQFLQADDYDSCHNANRPLTIIKRIPEFTSFKRAEFTRLFLISRIKSPIPPGTTLTIGGTSKYMGLFWFWDQPKDWLFSIHQSLQPSNDLYKMYQGMLYMLSNDFIAAHIVVDMPHANKRNSKARSLGLTNQTTATTPLVPPVSSFAEIKDKVVDHITSSSCCASLNSFDNNFIDAPNLYLLSSMSGSIAHTTPGTGGMTMSKNAQKQHDHMRQVIEELGSRGFHTVFTRATLFEKLIKYLNENVSEQKKYGNPILYRRLYPEQGQYLDSLVARKANCFVGATVPTTTSYMIQRMRALDRGIYEHYAEVNNVTYGDMHIFRQWGF